MKLHIVSISCLFFLCLLGVRNVSAELSVTGKWRIEQAVQQCEKTGHAITYPEYWKDSVTEENRETVCVAEQFAQLVAVEGEDWLEQKSVAFIQQCKTQSKEDNTKYYSCLQAGLKEVMDGFFSSSCQEVGDEGLWDKDMCQRLVSYIFLKDFDKIFKDQRPLIEKLMDDKILKYVFSPIGAIILLVLFVLDLVFLTGSGNWPKISTSGLMVGTVILVSWFLKDKWRFIGMGVAVAASGTGIILNHILALFKTDKKKRKY
ncbi:MAG: hypothetical protein JW847_04200 [Candidatus Omnitrophica bacterium]|nr:hypothetical protein [Candidatus Omnitrophota bacterium]